MKAQPILAAVKTCARILQMEAKCLSTILFHKQSVQLCVCWEWNDISIETKW